MNTTMAKVLKAVLGKVAKVKQTTNSYIHDILAEESAALAEEIRNYLRWFGLTTKRKSLQKEVQCWGSGSKYIKWVSFCFIEEMKSQT